MKAEIANAVIKRANGYCESCGNPLAEDFALHHRKLRSRGGDDCVSNLIAVHHHCHNLGTDSIHLKPKDATLKGFMCPSWEQPENYPMWLYGKENLIVKLDVKGNYLKYKEGKWEVWQVSM